jgi:hypothetical protein
MLTGAGPMACCALEGAVVAEVGAGSVGAVVAEVGAGSVGAVASDRAAASACVATLAAPESSWGGGAVAVARPPVAAACATGAPASPAASAVAVVFTEAAGAVPLWAAASPSDDVASTGISAGAEVVDGPEPGASRAGEAVMPIPGAEAESDERQASPAPAGTVASPAGTVASPAGAVAVLEGESPDPHAPDAAEELGRLAGDEVPAGAEVVVAAGWPSPRRLECAARPSLPRLSFCWPSAFAVRAQCSVSALWKSGAPGGAPGGAAPEVGCREDGGGAGADARIMLAPPSPRSRGGTAGRLLRSRALW